MAGPVESAIRHTITPGMALHTPSRHAPLVVDAIDSKGVVLLLGEKGSSRHRITWECLDGVMPFLREHGSEVAIGGRHEWLALPERWTGT